jgi:hypothetical protein
MGRSMGLLFGAFGAADMEIIDQPSACSCDAGIGLGADAKHQLVSGAKSADICEWEMAA